MWVVFVYFTGRIQDNLKKIKFLKYNKLIDISLVLVLFTCIGVRSNAVVGERGSSKSITLLEFEENDRVPKTRKIFTIEGLQNKP